MQCTRDGGGSVSKQLPRPGWILAVAAVALLLVLGTTSAPATLSASLSADPAMGFVVMGGPVTLFGDGVACADTTAHHPAHLSAPLTIEVTNPPAGTESLLVALGYYGGYTSEVAHPGATTDFSVSVSGSGGSFPTFVCGDTVGSPPLVRLLVVAYQGADALDTIDTTYELGNVD
jgi:hypothetical protein